MTDARAGRRVIIVWALVEAGQARGRLCTRALIVSIRFHASGKGAVLAFGRVLASGTPTFAVGHGADGGTRTLTGLLPRDFKSLASTIPPRPRAVVLASTRGAPEARRPA
jgi:hypothetical protein